MFFPIFSRSQTALDVSDDDKQDTSNIDLEKQTSLIESLYCVTPMKTPSSSNLSQKDMHLKMVSHYNNDNHNDGSNCFDNTKKTFEFVEDFSNNAIQDEFQVSNHPLLNSSCELSMPQKIISLNQTSMSSTNSDSETIHLSDNLSQESINSTQKELILESPFPKFKSRLNAKLRVKSNLRFKPNIQVQTETLSKVTRPKPEPTVFENPDVGIKDKELIVCIPSEIDPLRKDEVRLPKAALKEYIKKKEFKVYDFTGMEHADPKKWSKAKKLTHTILYGATTLVSQFNSAIMAPAVSQIMNEFNVPFKVAVLCTCLYILGIALGPLLFAPMSEWYGRKMSTLVPFTVGALFTFMAACSTKIWFVILFRGLAGVCSAAPMVISGGMLSDIWSTKVRGNYLIIYSNFVTLGPCLAPIVGPILLNHMSWRDLLYITSGLYVLVATVNAIFLSESYPPTILAREASERRMRTGNFLHHAKLDETFLTKTDFLKRHVRRPLMMMAVPLISLVAIYASFVFALFYLITTSVPTTFRDFRDFSEVNSGLPMLAVYAGATVLGVPINLLTGFRYARKLAENDNKPMPEHRLFGVLFLGVVLPIGMALFGLTVENDRFHWIFPCLGLALIGAGFFVIFQGCLNFLVDALPKYSASAMAVSTCMRSILAGFFPLFSREIFYTFGVEQGVSVLSAFAVLCVPIPFCFYFFSGAVNKRYQQYNFDL